ncbi:MAG: hypothetical protein DRP65_01585 [Planctomycetota bacterium]|nr:MAG: hypothetical protein DRP65_01585 [Planctomycetota bacterium]
MCKLIQLLIQCAAVLFVDFPFNIDKELVALETVSWITLILGTTQDEYFIFKKNMIFIFIAVNNGIQGLKVPGFFPGDVPRKVTQKIHTWHFCLSCNQFGL